VRDFGEPLIVAAGVAADHRERLVDVEILVTSWLPRNVSGSSSASTVV
jgi:hypothetical protein